MVRVARALGRTKSLMIEPSHSKNFGAFLVFLGIPLAAAAIVSSPYRTLGPILGLLSLATIQSALKVNGLRTADRTANPDPWRR